MTCEQKSSCWEEYSISPAENRAWRITSLLSTRPEVRLANSRASVVLPVPGRPAIRTIMIETDYTGNCAQQSRFEKLLLGAALSGHGGSSRLRPLDGNDVLRLAPIRITAGNHDVKNPLVALFLRFNQTERLHVKEIALHPVNLLLRHASTLQIDCESGQVRGSGVSLSGSRIAIVPPKLLLHFHCAHRRIHLNLFVKAVVVSLRKILHEIARPRAAEPSRGIKPRIEAQRLSSDNRQQRATRLQRFQLVVIFDTRQFQPVHFCILQEKGFVRGTEHGIPARPVQAVQAMMVHRLAYRSGCRPKSGAAEAGQQRDQT